MNTITAEAHPDFRYVTVLTRDDGRMAVVSSDTIMTIKDDKVTYSTPSGYEFKVKWNYLGTTDGRMYFSGTLDDPIVM